MKTIAAISTPHGIGGLSVVRISGKDAFKISQRVFKSHDGTLLEDMPGYTCKLGIVYYQNRPIDEVIASVFKSPRSYTGENMVQLSCHGSMFIAKSVLRSLLDAGAHMAGPGEFTKRAFLNGKMSLDKAESVMGLISSNYEKSRNISFSAYCGSLDGKINEIRQILIDILSNLNAEIDYSDEDIPEMSNEEIMSKIHYAKSEIKKLINSYSVGYIVKNGLRTAIIGAPNVGKSTLMNFLSKREKSIVTDIAGTTRDAIEESIIIGDVPLVLIDTAGIRETEDKIEKIGTEKSMEIAKAADLILILLDASREITNEEIKLINLFDKKKVIIIVNKIDMNSSYKCDFDNPVLISAKTGQGMGDLATRISNFVDFGSCEDENLIITTERQRDVLVKSLKSLKGIEDKIGEIPRDILSEIIKKPLKILSEFSGENIEKEIVDQIFSKFCVGK